MARARQLFFWTRNSNGARSPEILEDYSIPPVRNTENLKRKAIQRTRKAEILEDYSVPLVPNIEILEREAIRRAQKAKILEDSRFRSVPERSGAPGCPGRPKPRTRN